MVQEKEVEVDGNVVWLEDRIFNVFVSKAPFFFFGVVV